MAVSTCALLGGLKQHLSWLRATWCKLRERHHFYRVSDDDSSHCTDADRTTRASPLPSMDAACICHPNAALTFDPNLG